MDLDALNRYWLYCLNEHVLPIIFHWEPITTYFSCLVHLIELCNLLLNLHPFDFLKLLQVVERRNLVSFLTNSEVKEENTVSDSGGPTGRYKDRSASDSFSQSNKDMISETPSGSVKGTFLNEEMESGSSTRVEQEVADAVGLTREASLETAGSKTASQVLLESSETYDVKDANLEDQFGAKLDDTDVEDGVNPEIGNMEPPPLAGANVMNVIVVAAECAPWSKTGMYI